MQPFAFLIIVMDVMGSLPASLARSLAFTRASFAPVRSVGPPARLPHKHQQSAKQRSTASVSVGAPRVDRVSTDDHAAQQSARSMLRLLDAATYKQPTAKMCTRSLCELLPSCALARRFCAATKGCSASTLILRRMISLAALLIQLLLAPILTFHSFTRD